MQTRRTSKRILAETEEAEMVKVGKVPEAPEVL
jgi:hypothetical protein